MVQEQLQLSNKYFNPINKAFRKSGRPDYHFDQSLLTGKD